MLTFTKCVNRLGSKVRVKIGHNTYLERLPDGNFGVRLHATIILEVRADGSYRLNSGGHQTVTTKDRLNTFGPVHIHAKKQIWYAGSERFVDGMVIDGIARNRPWHTDTVIGMCVAMHNSGEYGNIPILADALEEAGYSQGDILALCRKDTIDRQTADMVIGHVLS